MVALVELFLVGVAIAHQPLVVPAHIPVAPLVPHVHTAYQILLALKEHFLVDVV